MLVEIDTNKIDQLSYILKKEWPLSMHAINFLKICHQWMPNDETFEVSLLYLQGNEDSGVFVGILKSDVFLPITTFFALDGYEEILKNELLNLEFTLNNVVFDQILNKHPHIIDEVLATKGYRKHYTVTLKFFHMPIEEAIKLNVECPSDVEFGSLSDHDIDDIYKRS